jgi:hypothetical protein
MTSHGATYSPIFKNMAGLKIAMAAHAPSMRGFIFGPATDAPNVLQWVMHIQCSWRREAAKDWDPAEGASLQEARLRELFHDQDLSKGTITNNTAYINLYQIR